MCKIFLGDQGVFCWGWRRGFRHNLPHNVYYVWNCSTPGKMTQVFLQGIRRSCGIGKGELSRLIKDYARVTQMEFFTGEENGVVRWRQGRGVTFLWREGDRVNDGGRAGLPSGRIKNQIGSSLAYVIGISHG